MLHRETVSESTLDLLIRLSGRPELGSFALAGGTSLALRFGHRLSVDLDFFSHEGFDNEELTAFLTREFGFDHRRSLPTGVAGFVEGVRVDFVKYRYALVEPFETMEGVRLMSLADVVAMKLSAVTNRGAKKDFYDLHELIGRLGLPSLVAHYQAKFPGTDPMMLVRSLAYFEDAEAQEEPVSLKGESWERVKAGIGGAVREMMLGG
jgi:hypothetical protein